MHGVNVDPLNVHPDPAELRSLGVSWVRLVARQDGWVQSYAAWCRSHGLKVLLVLTPESLHARFGPEAYRAWPYDAVQVGNEQDTTGTPSATMDPDTYNAFWYACCHGLGWPQDHGIPVLAGSFASGLPEKADRYLGITGVRAFGVHPYAKEPEEARQLLRAYRRRFPWAALWVTEWHRPVDQLCPFLSILAEEAVTAFWFCWSDAQTLYTEGSRMGLTDEHGRQTPVYTALKEAIVTVDEERFARLEARLASEERRNQYLTEWLWRYGDGDSELPYHARRLAHASDPAESVRPR